MYKTVMVALTAIPRITAKFLEVDGSVHKAPHTGIDFAVNEGTKLLSSGNGVIENVVNYGSQNIGKGVFIKLDNGIKLIYGHMSQIDVKVGQKVNSGDLIGLSGNTGHSTGAHMHLQAYNSDGNLINPINFAEGVFNKNNENGGKFLEWLNKNFNTNFKPESGLLGDDFNKAIEDKLNNNEDGISKAIDNFIDKLGSKISEKIGKIASIMAVDLLDVLSLGVIGYSFYQCVKAMMLNNRNTKGEALPLDKVFFGYFIFFILRILTTMAKLRGDLIGK